MLALLLAALRAEVAHIIVCGLQDMAPACSSHAEPFSLLVHATAPTAHNRTPSVSAEIITILSTPSHVQYVDVSDAPVSVQAVRSREERF